MTRQENVNKKVSLKEFVDENYRLLAVVGVFGGMTTLFTRLENAEYLASISFTTFLLLTIELYRTCRKYEFDKESYSLLSFEVLLSLIPVYLAFYIIQTYMDNLLWFWTGVFPILFGLAFVRYMQKRVVKFRHLFLFIGLEILAMVVGIFLYAMIELWF